MERVVIKARQYQQCALILMMLCYIFFFNQANGDEVRSGKFPLVVSTWPFLEAVRAAWTAVDGGLSAIDAVVEGCSACEQLRCDGTGQDPLMPNTCLLELQLAAVVECLRKRRRLHMQEHTHCKKCKHYFEVLEFYFVDTLFLHIFLVQNCSDFHQCDFRNKRWLSFVILSPRFGTEIYFTFHSLEFLLYQ